MLDSVCHLTSVHIPDDVRIYQKEARSLAKAGYEVTLVAPALKEAALEGVRWHRLPRPHSRLDRFWRIVAAAYRAALASGAKVVHIHDPELLFVGLALKLQGRKVVWDAHEDLPRQVMSKYWLPRPLRRPVAWVAGVFVRAITRTFDAIVAATPAIAKSFPPHKTVVVQNYPLLSEFSSLERIPYGERPNRVVYVGGITAIRGAMEMVRAMEYLPQDLKARFVLAGSFSPPELEQAVRSLKGWRHVDFLGWRDRKSVSAILASSRVGVVVFYPEPNHMEAQPNKLFEYMAAGIPVVASNFPRWREIIEGAGCGLMVDPLDPRAIADAIQWLLVHPKEAEEMGKRGREAVLEKYNWDKEAEKLLNMYRRLS